MIEHASLFNPHEIAKSLKEVAVDIIQTEHHKVVSRWFHSNKDADLFIWLDESTRIIKQQITFCGQVVDWNAVEGVRTGFVFEDETIEKKPGQTGSDIIRYDNKPIKASILQAIEILTKMNQLDEGERQSLVSNFSSGAAGQTLGFGELYQRLSKPKKGRQTHYFFANLRRLLKKLFS